MHITKSATLPESRLSVPTSLYGFKGMNVMSAVKGICRFGLACLHDPFVWSYSNTDTHYKKYLQRELLKRQVEYIGNLKKKNDGNDGNMVARASMGVNVRGIKESDELLKLLEPLLKLAYDGVDLKSIPYELLKEGSKIGKGKDDLNDFKKICEKSITSLDDLYKKFPALKKIYIEHSFNHELEKGIQEAEKRREKKLTAEAIDDIKSISEKHLALLLTPAYRQTNMNNIILETIQVELVFEGLFFALEALWGKLGICAWHNDVAEVSAFWRLNAGIAGIFLTLPIFMGFLNTLWGMSAARGTVDASKTWGEVFKKTVTDAQNSWKTATATIKDFHPFVQGIFNTAMIMIPWALLCYYDMGYAYYMYAWMDIAFLIKGKILSEGTFPNIKEIGEYLAIGWLRGYFKFWLMPKDEPLIKMIAQDNVLTVVSILLGKAMHILYPFGNGAKPEGVI